jgi:protein TonB
MSSFMRPVHVVPIAASCALHAALAIVLALVMPHWAGPLPSVLEAEIVEIERPAPRAEQPPPPRAAAPRPSALSRVAETRMPVAPAPPPVAQPPVPAPPPPVPPPVAAAPAPTPVPAPITPAAPVSPAPPAREPFTIAAPEAPGRAGELSASAERPVPPATPVAKAAPDEGITRMATPSGGYQVRPSYPAAARRLGIEGTSLLRVYVSADGRVTDVQVDQSAGHPDLDRAATDAVRRWKFEPGRRGAEAVGMWVRLPVQFVLR